jgi:hypothetical protein
MNHGGGGLIAFGFVAFMGHNFDPGSFNLGTLGARDAGSDASGHGFDYTQEPSTLAAIATLVCADRFIRESQSDSPDDL